MGTMSNATKFGKVIVAFAKAHKTDIAIVSGGICLGAAIIDCGRNTVKVTRKIDEENTIRESEGKDKLSKKEIIKTYGPTYWTTGVYALAGYGLIGYSYHVRVSELATMGLALDAYKKDKNALRDAVNDVLEGEENKEVKQKIAEKYNEKLYCDSDQPIDRFIPSENRSKGNKLYGHSAIVERYKDPYGGEFWATTSDLRYAKLDVIRSLESGWAAGLPDFYAAVADDVDYPENANNYIWDINSWPQERVSNMLKSFDILRERSDDVDGLYWQLKYTIEPTYIK